MASISVGFILSSAVHAADTFGNGTVIPPTTASGGTGTAANLQTDDDTRYSVAKSATMTVGGFGSYTGTVNSVYLFAQYSVESGYSGTNALKVNGVDTTIVPADRDYGRWTYTEITGGSFGIDTTAEIESMVVTFTNNDGAAGDAALFDCVYVVVNPQSSFPILPAWCEDFNGTGQADPLVWTYEVGYQRNNELQYYVAGASNGWQEGGNFIIEGRKDTANEHPGYDYTSASIITVDKYYWKYGRAQIRAKIPCLPGMWPAIWGTGEVGQWPHNGEVDIMEYYGDAIKANCAVGNTTAWSAKWFSSSRSVPTFEAVDSNWRNSYHIWTMQWDEQTVRLYVDNVLLKTVAQTSLKNTDGYNPSWGPQYPFTQPFTCWLNLAMGGAGGNPAATMNSGPQRYFIDYWKIWEGATGNVAPTDIMLDSPDVKEGLPAGTVVGNLTAVDADPAEVMRYQLVAGTGDTHNSQFVIPEFVSDNTLQCVLMTAAVLDYDDGATRSIRVRTTDIEGATHEEVMTIHVMPDQVIMVSQSQLAVAEGGTNTFGVRLRTLPVSDITVNVSRSSGDPDLSVSAGSTLMFTPLNGTDWQQVTIAAAEDADITNGTATILCVDGSGTYSSESVSVSEIENDNDPPVVDAGQNRHVFLVGPASADPTPGADIFLDAGLDDGANSIWEDSLGLWNATIAGTGLTYIADAGSDFSGITSAYDFPGALAGGGGCQGTDLEDMGLDTQPITLELWFKPDQSPGYSPNGQILWETGGGTGFGIFYNDGIVEVAHDGNKGQISADVRELTDEFIQVVVTFDTGSTTYNFKLYINGNSAVTSSYVDSDLSGNDDAGLGRQGGGNVGGAGGGSAGTESFDGQIAIFRAYHNQILSAAEVAANYDSIVGATVHVSLNGTVTDSNGEPTTVAWTKVSGPGAVNFAGPTAVETTAMIAAEGTYVLRLTADDGTLQSHDEVTITVGAPSPYGNWASGTFSNPFTMAGLTSDPDGDSVANLLEFAFGTDPTLSDMRPLAYTPVGNVNQTGIPLLQYSADQGESPAYRAVFVRRKDHATAGIAYNVDFSADLSQWTTSVSTPTLLTGVGSSGAYEAVSVPFPATVPANGGSEDLPPGFFRVGVQSN